MSDTTASATRIGVNSNDMSIRSAPTICDAAPMKGVTPTVAMTWNLERTNADTARSTTRFIINARFHSSTTPYSRLDSDEGNQAAKQIFLRSLASPRVTAGFQYLLQNTFADGAAFAVASHDPSEPLESYDERKLNTLIRSFGTLLKFAIEQTLKHEPTESASEFRAHRRARLSGHVGIAQIEPSQWNSVGSQKGMLGGQRRSAEAQKRIHAGAFRIMRNLDEWNGKRSPLKGYWQNKDGSLVEIHPDFLGDPEPSLLSSLICIPDDTKPNQATQKCRLGDQSRFAQEEGKTLQDQLFVSPHDTAPNDDVEVDGGGDGIEAYGLHSDLDVRRGLDSDLGSYQPQKSEGTWNGALGHIDEGYTGLTWADYLETDEEVWSDQARTWGLGEP